MAGKGRAKGTIKGPDVVSSVIIDTSNAERQLSNFLTKLNKSNKTLTIDVGIEALKNAKQIWDAMASEMQKVGKSAIFDGMAESFDKANNAFKNMTVTLNGKELKGLVDVVKSLTTSDFNKISKIDFGIEGIHNSVLEAKKLEEVTEKIIKSETELAKTRKKSSRKSDVTERLNKELASIKRRVNSIANLNLGFRVDTSSTDEISASVEKLQKWATKLIACREEVEKLKKTNVKVSTDIFASVESTIQASLEGINTKIVETTKLLASSKINDVDIKKDIDSNVKKLKEQIDVSRAQEEHAKAKLRTQEQINAELDNERKKLKEIEAQQEKNDAARERFKREQTNYGKEVLGVDYPVYDSDLLKGAAKELKEFNNMLETRNKFQEKYLKLCQIIEKYYINDKPGKYSISNGIYKSLDDFFDGYPEMVQLEKLNDSGQKRTNKDIDAMFKNMMRMLQSEGSATARVIAEGTVYSGPIGQDLDRKETELNREMQNLYEARELQLKKINALREEEINLIKQAGQEKMKETLTLVGELQSKYGTEKFSAIFGDIGAIDASNAEEVYNILIAKEEEYFAAVQARHSALNEFIQINGELAMQHQKSESFMDKYAELSQGILEGNVALEEANKQLQEFVANLTKAVEKQELLFDNPKNNYQKLANTLFTGDNAFESKSKGTVSGYSLADREIIAKAIVQGLQTGLEEINITLNNGSTQLTVNGNIEAAAQVLNGLGFKAIKTDSRATVDNIPVKGQSTTKELKFADGTILNAQQVAAVEKYCAMLKKSMGEAYDEAKTLHHALELVFDISQGNVANLMDRFHNGNPASNAVLKMLTGMDVNTQKNRDAALRSTNPNAYDQIIAEQEAAAEKAKAELAAQKSDFQKQWDEFVSAMLGGDAFENESKLVKGKILKAFSQYGVTASAAIDELNKAWLSGGLEGKSGNNKWIQAYIDYLDGQKEYIDSIRDSKAGDLDIDSLLGFGGTTHMDESKAQALRDEAAAWDDLIAKKKEYYGITTSVGPTVVEENNKLISSYEQLAEATQKYVDLAKQRKSASTPEYESATDDIHMARIWSDDDVVAMINAAYKTVGNIKAAQKAGSSTYIGVNDDGSSYQDSLYSNTLQEVEQKLRGYIYHLVDDCGEVIEDVTKNFSGKRLRSFVEKEANKYLEIISANADYRVNAEVFNEPIEKITEQICANIMSAIPEANKSYAQDVLDNLFYRASDVNRYTLSNQTNRLGEYMGITTPYDEIAENVKKIESYEELCDAVERYNALTVGNKSNGTYNIIYGGDSSPGFDEQSEKEYEELIARFKKTGITDIYSQIEYRNNPKDIEKLAITLGIEVPKAANEAAEANKKLQSSYEGLAEAVEKYAEVNQKMWSAYTHNFPDLQQLIEERNSAIDTIKAFFPAQLSNPSLTQDSISMMLQAKEFANVPAEDILGNLETHLKKVEVEIAEEKRLQAEAEELVKQKSEEAAKAKKKQIDAGKKATEQAQSQSDAEQKVAKAATETNKALEKQSKIKKQAVPEMSIDALTGGLESEALKQLREASSNETLFINLKAVFSRNDLESQIRNMAKDIDEWRDFSLGKIDVASNSNDIITIDLYNDKLKVAKQQTWQLVEATDEMDAHLKLVGEHFNQNIKALDQQAQKVADFKQKVNDQVNSWASEGYLGKGNLFEHVDETFDVNGNKISDLTQQIAQFKASLSNIDASSNLKQLEQDFANIAQKANEAAKAQQTYINAAYKDNFQNNYKYNNGKTYSDQVTQDSMRDYYRQQETEAQQFNLNIKSIYNELISTMSQINSLDTKINDLSLKDGGSGIYAKTISSLQNQKSALVAQIRSINDEINKSLNVAPGESGLSTFFDVAREKAALTAEEIQKFDDLLRQSEEIGFNFASKLTQQIQPVVEKIAQLKQMVADGTIDQNSDVAKNILASSDGLNAKLKAFKEDPSAFAAMDIKKYVNDISEYINAVDKATQAEQRYFAGKTKYTSGQTAGSLEDYLKNQTKAVDETQKKLTAAAQQFAKDSGFGDAMITGFSKTADGISKIDFSVFDQGSASLRTFSMEMGSVTEGIYKTETTINRSFANIQNASKQLQATEGLLGKLSASGVNIDASTATAQISKLLDARKALSDALKPDSGADQNTIIKLTNDLKLASSQTEQLYKQMLKMGDAINSGQAIDLNKINPKGDVYGQLVDKTRELAVTQGAARVQIGSFDEATNTLNASLINANGTVEQFKVSMYGLGGECAAQQTGVTKLASSWDQLKASLLGAGKQLVTALVGYNVFYKAISSVREGVGYVKEIDLALTELKKVTDETEASYRNFLNTASGTAGEIGSTVSDFTEATANFARLGYTMDESASMAKTAIVYKNVADGIDTVEASTDSIISTMKAFGIESDNTMSIVDRFNEVKFTCLLIW